MSRPPRGSDNPQAQEKLSTDYAGDQQSDFREAISRLKDANTETKELKTEVSETNKGVNQIAKIMGDYFNRSKNNEEATEKDGSRDSQRSKVSGIYDAIYKGSYYGIIDGLKANREMENEAEILEAQKEFRKDLAKGSVNALVKLPGVLHRGFINLFAFERSEILNTWRAIRHSSAIDADGRVDYQQRAFRMMLEKDSKKEKKKFDPNAVALSSQELLEQIRDNTGEGDTTGSLWWKKTETQISLLRDIKVGVGGQRRTFLMAMGLNFKRFGTVGRYQVTLLEQIRDLQKQSTTTSIPFWRRSESQIDILSQIRDALKPEATAKFWTKPIGQFFKKDKTINYTKEQSEVIEDLYLETLDQTKLLGKIRDRLDSGLGVFPRDQSKFTQFEEQNLQRIDNVRVSEDGTTKAVTDTTKAIKDLPNVFSLDDARKRKEETQLGQLSLFPDPRPEDTIGAEESTRETAATAIATRDNTGEANVYLADIAAKLEEMAPEQKTLLEKMKGWIDTAGDVSETIQGATSLFEAGDTVRDTIVGQKVFGTVELGDKTLKELRDIEDDGMGLPGRKRRSKGPKTKKPGLLKRAKGGLGKVGGKIAGVGTGAAALGAKAIPLLSASGSTIAAGGAATMAGAGAMVAAAGAAGYGIGTLINKGIDAATSKITGGEAGSLGEAFWNFTHRKQIEQEKLQAAETEKKMADFRKRMAERKSVEAQEAKLIAVNKAELDRAAGVKPEQLKGLMDATLSASALNMSQLMKQGLSPEQIQKLKGMSREEATKFLESAKGLGDLSPNDIIDKVRNIDMSKINVDSILGAGAGAASMAKGVAAEIVERAKGADIGATLGNIFQKTEDARMKLMSEMKDAMEWASKSETVTAMGESISDVKNVVTGATTNISLPVAAHDTDRATSLLVDTFGA